MKGQNLLKSFPPGRGLDFLPFIATGRRTGAMKGKKYRACPVGRNYRTGDNPVNPVKILSTFVFSIFRAFVIIVFS